MTKEQKIGHLETKCKRLTLALSGCSSQPNSTIEIPSGSTTSISINGKQFQVRDGNVTYNGQKIAVPENSSIKITHNNKSVFIFADDELVYEE